MCWLRTGAGHGLVFCSLCLFLKISSKLVFRGWKIFNKRNILISSLVEKSAFYNVTENEEQISNKELIIIKILVSAEHFILTDRNEIVVQIFILSFQ